MRILFMGTSEFAVPCLEILISEGFDICGVFTQPDKPKGRKFILTQTPVKVLALKHNIRVFQPNTLKDEGIVNTIKDLAPDIIVVAAYGMILPVAVLDIPALGCINVHASLLPKYRGAGPYQWSVINGEKETGITTMYMAKGIDTGDMILKIVTQIGEDETAGELYERLMAMGAGLLLKTLLLIKGNKAPREKQDDTLSSYAPMLDKSISQIKWQKKASQIHNLIRGLSPWPIACTKLHEKTIKVLKSVLSDEHCDASVGEVIKTSSDGIYVCCGDKRLIIIKELQEEGKKKLTAAEYLCGHPIKAGTILGE
jgi:methionyl-tRNA formyltransferase